ncbi:unnamed protein product [Gongylonema pulchrum]|uniref:HECT domain-containing protein n=1 Tax=Gongylonema pulchrum TaxID=637853 RepID=A0A183CX62_9BILA|nr:unnamed protein product [Gongylonema pulchrum]
MGVAAVIRGTNDEQNPGRDDFSDRYCFSVRSTPFDAMSKEILLSCSSVLLRSNDQRPTPAAVSLQSSDLAPPTQVSNCELLFVLMKFVLFTRHIISWVYRYTDEFLRLDSASLGKIPADREKRKEWILRLFPVFYDAFALINKEFGFGRRFRVCVSWDEWMIMNTINLMRGNYNCQADEAIVPFSQYDEKELYERVGRGRGRMSRTIHRFMELFGASNTLSPSKFVTGFRSAVLSSQLTFQVPLRRSRLEMHLLIG